jgi:hypothetical protein
MSQGPSTSKKNSRTTTATKLAIGLGVFSLALGAAELLAPRRTSRAAGLKAGDLTMRAYGAREIAAGVGLLVAKNKTPWLWARVAGDVLDLATIGATRRDRNRAAMSLAAVAGVTLMDVLAARVTQSEAKRARVPVRDYSNRSGFPLPAQEMRGAALEDFVAPEDMRTPAAMRPYEVEDVAS